jgi:hypothetical protein
MKDATNINKKKENVKSSLSQIAIQPNFYSQFLSIQEPNRLTAKKTHAASRYQQFQKAIKKYHQLLKAFQQ